MDARLGGSWQSNTAFNAFTPSGLGQRVLVVGVTSLVFDRANGLHRTDVAQYCGVDEQAWLDRFVAQLRHLGAPCKSALLYQIAADRYRTHGHSEPEESATTEFAGWPPIVGGPSGGR